MRRFFLFLEKLQTEAFITLSRGLLKTMPNISDKAFCLIVNVFFPLTIFVKRSILDIWQGSVRH